MTRRARDYYPTPAWCLDRLADVVELDLLGAPERPVDAAHYDRVESAWEPAAGRGHLTRALREHVPAAIIRQTDIEGVPELGIAGHDFRDTETTTAGPHRIITNPPFGISDAFVRRAVQVVHPDGAVVMLLRLTWLGGGSDAHAGDWLQSWPPSVYVLPERPRFTDHGSGDSSPVAWCVWRAPPRGNELPRYTARFRVLVSTPLERRRRDESAVHDDGPGMEPRQPPLPGLE